MVRFDAKALYEALDERRSARGMTWAMVRWLGVPVETFVRKSNR